jgi:Zn/Cd-binding protein ZinT
VSDDPSADNATIEWIETEKPQTGASRAGFFASFGAAGHRADVERVGISDSGVTFVKTGATTFVPWAKLEPSKMQYGRGFLILKASDGPRGGAWVVDGRQGRAIVTHRSWRFPDYSQRIIPKWLS